MSKAMYPLRLPLSVEKAAAGERRRRVFESMDRGSGGRKSRSGGNRSGLFQETRRPGHGRGTHEVSAHCGQNRARGGRRAPIAPWVWGSFEFRSGNGYARHCPNQEIIVAFVGILNRPTPLSCRSHIRSMGGYRLTREEKSVDELELVPQVRARSWAITWGSSTWGLDHPSPQTK